MKPIVRLSWPVIHLLHGNAEWLDQLAENGTQPEMALVDDVDRHISHEEAAARLTLILESIVENYSEYRDYNSTTTQSRPNRF